MKLVRIEDENGDQIPINPDQVSRLGESWTAKDKSQITAVIMSDGIVIMAKGSQNDLFKKLCK